MSGLKARFRLHEDGPSLPLESLHSEELLKLYRITSHEKARDCIWGWAIKPVKSLEENVADESERNLPCTSAGQNVVKVQLLRRELHVNALSDDDATAELLFMGERQLWAPITCCHMLRFYQTLFILDCCGKKQNGTLFWYGYWVTEEKSPNSLQCNTFTGNII